MPVETDAPKTTPVTFILSGHRLVTVRYDDPRPFAIVEYKLARSCPAKVSGESVLMDLLDAVVDRSADILERIGGEVDQVSHSIFEPEDGRRAAILQGRAQGAWPQGRSDLESARKPGVDRPVCLCSSTTRRRACAGTRTCVHICKSMRRDTASLSDHASYLSSKITFLLDAMLGVVNIEQNDIIKIFSIAAVI